MKKTVIFTMLILVISTFTGCSLKNIETNKIKTNTHLDSSKTLINSNNQFVEIGNELELTELYRMKECGDKSIYLGFGTNYFKFLIGQDAYDGQGGRYKDNERTSAWVFSPIMLPMFTFAEIITLSPLHHYKDIRTCNLSGEEKEKKHVMNYGSFSGIISVESKNENRNKNFQLNKKKMPFKLSLKDENDIFSSSRKSIDSSKGYTVRINGYYISGKEKIEVNETKIIE